MKKFILLLSTALFLTFGMNSCSKQEVIDCKNTAGISLCETTWRKDSVLTGNDFRPAGDTTSFQFTNQPSNGEYVLKSYTNGGTDIGTWKINNDSTLVYKTSPTSEQSFNKITYLNSNGVEWILLKNQTNGQSKWRKIS